MQFDSLQTLWQMAGHGPFVWGAYLISVLVLALLIWAPLARQRRILRELRGAEQRRRQRVAVSAGS